MTEGRQDVIAPVFELEAMGLRAQGQLRGNRFVVLEGSQARVEEAPSLASHTYAALRTGLLTSGHLIPGEQGSLVFTADTEFASPSAAAVAVLGRAANGRTEWKWAGHPGQTYGDWLAQSGISAPASLAMDPVEVTWPPFFRELALQIMEYQDRQPELIGLLRDAGIAINHDEGEPLSEIDPFTFFSLVLKHTSDTTALAFFQKLAQRLDLHTPVPLDLTGVPWSNPMNAWFFAYRSQRQPQDVPTLWNLARQALTGVLDGATFAEALTIRKVALPKLTQGLFWLNPEMFLPLNGVNVPYLESLRVQGAARVTSLPEYQAILSAARGLTPDFITLSHTAWLRAQQGKQVAVLMDGHFPFDQFKTDAAAYTTDRVKGNMILDRKYAPLLLELFGELPMTFLQPSRSPYSGKEQVAVKVALGGGVKAEGRTFGRALMFPDNSGFEYVSFPAGLTLEVGWPDGKGDGPRQALQDLARQQQLLSALLTPLPLATPATLTLNTEIGPLKLLPLQPERAEEVAATLQAYMEGVGKSRRLRVGITLTPEELESPVFAEHLEAALAYTDTLTGVLDALALTPELLPAAEVIEVPGQTDAGPVRQDASLPGVALNKILYGPPAPARPTAWWTKPWPSLTRPSCKPIRAQKAAPPARLATTS